MKLPMIMLTALMLPCLAAPPHLAVVARKNTETEGGGTSPTKTNLVSWWEMEEDTTDDRVDSHTNGNDLTPSGVIYRATGKINYGADFEESVARSMTIADSSISGWAKGGTNPLTINFWFKPETITGEFMSQGSEMIVRVGSGTNDVEFVLNGLTTNDRVSSSSNAISIGSWTMITCVYRSGGDLEIWIDGEKDNSVTPTGTWADDTNDLEVGRRATLECDGVMDELSIWNDDLSEDEITWLYTNGFDDL